MNRVQRAVAALLQLAGLIGVAAFGLLALNVVVGNDEVPLSGGACAVGFFFSGVLLLGTYGARRGVKEEQR